MAATWKPMTDEEFASEFAEARERARIADETEPRAVAARYNRGTGRIEIDLRDGCRFEFPAELGQGLRGATPEQLAEVEVVSGGYGLHWEELDADLTVPGLLAGRFGSKRWMSEMARQLGRISTPAKAAAARENGKKGGRPRKTPKAA